MPAVQKETANKALPMDLHASQQFPVEYSLLLPMATPYFIPGNFQDAMKAVASLLSSGAKTPPCAAGAHH